MAIDLAGANSAGSRRTVAPHEGGGGGGGGVVVQPAGLAVEEFTSPSCNPLSVDRRSFLCHNSYRHHSWVTRLRRAPPLAFADG
jgi:hypothetical protein